MRYLIITCLLLSGCFAGRGQQLFTQHYPIEVYQGASQNWAIRQDKNGVLYVANTEGVLRYDGNKWDLISLPNKASISSLDIDSTGNIYIGSDSEIGYFQRRLGGKYKYISLLAKLPDSCKYDSNIGLVRVFNKQVFLLGKDHVYIYTQDHFKILRTHCKGFLLNKNTLYAQRGDALYKYKNGDFETTPYFKTPAEMKYKWITDYRPGFFLILDGKNQAWIVDEKHPDRGHILSEELNRNLKNLKIETVTCLDNGNIAVHIGDGILFFNKEGKRYGHIANDKLIRWGSLFEDKQHNLWANADSDILQIITSSPLSYYDDKNGLQGFILSFGRKDNHHYIGTDNGILYMQDRNTFIRLPETKGTIWSFQQIHNKLYVAEDSGVLELDGKKATKIIDQDLVFSLCEIKNQPDKIIISTGWEGLWLLHKKRKTWTKTKIKGFTEEVRFMQEDEEGNIWASQHNNSIWKLKLNERMDSVISQTIYDTTKGLPANTNNRLLLLNGKIVATTVDGIYSYNHGSNRFEPMEKYRKALGKAFCIYSLAENKEGDIYFWGATPHEKEIAGVLKKQADGSFKVLLTPFNKTAVTFRNLRVDVDAPVLITNSGDVWIGSSWKILCYAPDQKTFYNDPTKVSIQKVWARDSLVCQNPEKTSVQTLPFVLNNVKFEFLCPFLEDIEKNQYQFKLEGFENKWSDWTQNKEAVFTNLHEGNYTFHVRAKNIYDAVSEPVSFSFRIVPPWFRTRLAYFAYLVLSIALLYLITQLNIRRVERKQVVLEGIIKEKTKELTDANEELLSQSNLLSEQNHQLQDAQVTIKNQNKEIKHRNETLEIEVHKRTKELVRYNQQLEQFAFVTAHNLRGPVARILGLGTVLDMTSNVTDEVKTITEKLVFTTREIDSVIADLNHILHIKNTPSLLEELSLDTEISRVISGFAKDIQGTNAIVQIDFSEVPSIITSQAYLYSIIYQLLSNALKFRHPERVPEIRITAVNIDDYIRVSVSDNGLGIDLQKFKDKLFTLYGRFHLHIEGKGMGLYLAQTQILALGGSIEVKSEVNLGTTFEVFFKKIHKM